jgi:hypothetical protein
MFSFIYTLFQIVFGVIAAVIMLIAAWVIIENFISEDL